MIKNTDLKFLAMLNACQAALALSSQLPQTDIVMDIEEILKTQMLLGLHILYGSEYGVKKLDKFIEKTQKTIDEIAKKETI